MLWLRLPNCVYCGGPATCRDHFIPLRCEQPDDHLRNFVVSACHPCNSTVTAYYFPTFEAKANWLRRRRRINPLVIATYAPLVSAALVQIAKGQVGGIVTDAGYAIVKRDAERREMLAHFYPFPRFPLTPQNRNNL
jgi:hypothetical protein